MMKKLKVYLAGPWFYGDQPERLSKVEALLDGYKELKVFSPRRESLVTPDSTMSKRTQTFDGNVEHVRDADFIVALVDDSDKGTLFECGLAYAFGVPILYYCETAQKKPFNLMLAESCTELGYVTSIEELKERIDKILQTGLEWMNEGVFEGVVE